jgi:transcriptional regulator with XRE-family HTH domain
MFDKCKLMLEAGIHKVYILTRIERGETRSMITANQLRAARALLNIDQRQTADLADLSVPTIQRMEASDGVIRANVDSLMKLVSALENAGIELINPGAASPSGGRGVRLREHIANPKTRNVRQSRQSSARAMERAR